MLWPLLVVVLSSQSRLALGECRTISDQNMNCLNEAVSYESTNNCNLEINIYENCPVDNPILTLEGGSLSVDDCAENFQFIDGNKLALKQSLDTETALSLTCIPSFIPGDDSLEDIAAIVNAINTNEYEPFTTVGSPYTSSIQENNLENDEILTFGVKDLDYGETATVTYTTDFTNGDVFQMTQVGDCSAVETEQCDFKLVAKKSLDYETGNFFQLAITFTTEDSNKLASSVEMIVLVFVEDMPDSPPIWISTIPSINVPEDPKPVNNIFQVQAIDRDVSIDNEIKYTITAGNTDDYFAIAGNGQVSTTTALDRENLTDTFFSLEITATEVLEGGDDAPPPNFAVTLTNVQITDVNDNSPTFEDSLMRVTIFELTDKDYELSESVTVTDMDQGDGGAYTVTSNDAAHLVISDGGRGSLESTFILDAIFVSGNNIFDFESFAVGSPAEINFTLTATETENATHIGEMTLVITIEDDNDNAPVFVESQYSVYLAEDATAGTTIITVAATDDDVSIEYGTPSIRYSLKDCDPNFEVNPETGVVTVSADSQLDYESEQSLVCEVIASDKEGASDALTSTVALTVTITDINDTPPEVTLDTNAAVTVPEDTETDTEILQVTAVDPDTNADLIFTLQYQDNLPEDVQLWFKLTEVTCGIGSDDVEKCAELRVAAPLDRETQETVLLTIIVSDANTAAGYVDKDTATVTVTIEDVNDEDPELCADCLTDLKVNENSVGGTPVALVSATDPDSADQGNLRYSCSVSDYVEIDEQSGNLTVKEDADIDREMPLDDFTVTITVTDMADNTDERQVTITVVDQNDNSPSLDKDICNLKYYVSESDDNGTTVGTMEATDVDEGSHAKLYYQLQNMNSGTGINPITPFTINSETGEISVSTDGGLKELDRESYPSWTLTVWVYDFCEPIEPFCTVRSDDCNVLVTVEDVNDEPPKLVEGGQISAGEELMTGDDVPNTVITATDDDLGNTTATEIHYEVVGFLTYRGEDMGYLPFEAVDFDEVDNTYQLVVWSCKLNTTMSLTQMTGSYILQVNATDGPMYGISNEVTFDISLTITDYNDNYPIIKPIGCLKEHNQIVVVTEEMYKGDDPIPCEDNGTMVMVRYSDADSSFINSRANIIVDPDDSTVLPNGTTGQVDLFEMRKSPDNEYTFGLYMKEGAANLSLEEGQSYNLTIVATDTGSPPLSFVSWIFVNVSDLNEYLPNFCQDAQEQPGNCYDVTYLEEESTNNASFHKAADEDNANNVTYDTIYYHLVGGESSYFTINNQLMPTLTPWNPLDRDNGKEEFIVLVQASNYLKAPGDVQGNEPISTDMIQVRVILMDINDNSPTFPRPAVVYGSLEESDAVDTVAAYLEADDLDLNETLRYAIEGDIIWTPTASVANTVFRINNDGAVGRVEVTTTPSSLAGYCVFTASVVDKLLSGEHKDIATVQIFIIRTADQIPFYFYNDIATLQEREDNIIEILSDTFGYLAFIDSMSTSSGTDNSTQDSVVFAHFVNDSSNTFLDGKDGVTAPGNLVPTTTITRAATDGYLSFQLQEDLAAIDLDLYSIGESLVIQDSDLAQQLLIFQILLAVVALLLGSMVFLLLAAYIVRTRKLERRVKVLSTNTFGSQASELNRTGVDAVPNSNMFKGEGANPMWNTSVQDFQRQDNASLSSGDSVLVGVEDNPEFSDYKAAARAFNEDSGPSAPAEPSFLGAGGVTSSNPLFAGIEMADDGRRSPDKSSIDGDLGISNPNFTFGK